MKPKYSDLLLALLKAFTKTHEAVNTSLSYCHALTCKCQDSLDLFVSRSCSSPSWNLTDRLSSKLNLNPTVYPFQQLWKVSAPEINFGVLEPLCC